MQELPHASPKRFYQRLEGSQTYLRWARSRQSYRVSSFQLWVNFEPINQYKQKSQSEAHKSVQTQKTTYPINYLYTFQNVTETKQRDE